MKLRWPFHRHRHVYVWITGNIYRCHCGSEIETA
jgi:hypothetical protein